MFFKFCVSFLCISIVSSQLCNQKRRYVTCDTWKERLKSIKWYENGNEVEEDFPGIIDIEFSNCGIEIVGEEVFEDYLNEIRYISLANNNIANLGDNLFNNNIELEILKLNNNNISRLSDKIFKPLINLKHLYLQDNAITELTTQPFEKLTNLTILHLERNKIWQIGHRTFLLNINLRYLNLRGNPIKKPSNKYHLTDNNPHILSNSFLFDMDYYDTTIVATTVKNTGTASEGEGMLKYLIGAGVGGLFAVFIIVVMFFAFRKRLMTKRKTEDTPYYDEIKNDAIRASTATTNSYIQPNFSPSSAHQNLTARNLSYLEPKVLNLPSSSRNISRSDSYEKDIELPSMPDRGYKSKPNAYDTFSAPSFMNK